MNDRQRASDIFASNMPMGFISDKHTPAGREDHINIANLFSEAHVILRQNGAFVWLIEKFKVALNTTCFGINLVDSLIVLSPTVSQTLSIQLEWSIQDFLDEQYCDLEDNVRLGDIITLSGLIDEAQAMTCNEYMQQIWPSTGSVTLRGLETAISERDSHMSTCTYFDRTGATFTVSDTFVSVRVVGSRGIIAEVGQQCAWLGAVCRVSPHPNKSSYCTPQTQIIQRLPSLSLSIQYLCSDTQIGIIPARNDYCWQYLFRNPTIAKGFPILARNHDERGLEISLSMMVALSDANRATQFDRSFIIKGCSTAFIITRAIQNSICWHFVYNSEGHRLSFLSARESCFEVVAIESINDIEFAEKRNFVGWTSSASLELGKHWLCHCNFVKENIFSHESLIFF